MTYGARIWSLVQKFSFKCGKEDLVLQGEMHTFGFGYNVSHR